ncbi:MAG: hypothetical protein R3B13_19210 [Polyangiaceae bacterium]
MRLVLLLGGLALGCTAHVDRRYDELVSAAEVRANHETVRATCSRDGTLENCGLLATVVDSPRYQQWFADHYCVNLDDAACTERYSKLALAKLESRYHLADFTAVERRCSQRPDACDTLRAYELELLESHNDAASLELAETRVQLAEDRDAAKARRLGFVVRLLGRAVFRSRRARHHHPDEYSPAESADWETAPGSESGPVMSPSSRRARRAISGL